jgi:hypothetical protein
VWCFEHRARPLIPASLPEFVESPEFAVDFDGMSGGLDQAATECVAADDQVLTLDDRIY